MKSKLRTAVIASLLALPLLVFSQSTRSSDCPGVPGACGYTGDSTSAIARSGPQTPQNGNGTLGVCYSMTKCGLDFTSASQRLGRRGPLAGVLQPAPFVIAGIPAGAVIEKAFLWAEGSGNGAAQTATVNGPLGPGSYPMAIVGQGPDKCWGYSGSYTYRADVTASVNGNGTYNISGILTNPPNASNDMDGATLVVIWSQASMAWRGTINIADGAYVVNGGTATYNLPYTAVCGATSGAKAFFSVGDIQFNPTSWSANGTAAPLTWNWWDFLQVNTTVAVAQASSAFIVNTAGDCFNLCLAGLYYRTTCISCSTCTLALSGSTNLVCNGQCTGTATVISTGIAPFTYAWAPAAANTTTGLTNTATGLCAGVYTCTATDATGCISTQTVTITQPPAITATQSQVNVTCFGSCNGSATVVASGGTGTYTYTWAPSGGNAATASGLCAGTYTCTISAPAGCFITQSFTITQPPAITATPSQVNVTCFGSCNGSATVIAAGGTGTYTYSWLPSGGTAATASGLCAGTYTCTISSPAGCFITQSFTITQPPLITATQSQVNVTCNGSCTGSATVVASGGTGTYTYAWTPSGGTSSTASALCAGTYTCTISSPVGCSITQSFTITQPPAITATQSQINVTCFGSCNGSATVVASGGTGTYTYAWAPSGGTSATASGLCAGTYTCTISSPAGCFITQSFTITQPPAITATQSQVNVTCFGSCNGSATVVAAGGTGTYTYAWLPSGGTAATASGLCAGTYTCTISSPAGCFITQSFTITQPPAITATSSQVNVTCFGSCNGSATVVAAGGTGTYSYAWLPSGGTAATASVLCAGSYTCTISSPAGCFITQSFTITQPPAITATQSQVNVSCNGGCNGTATVVASGGTGTYTYAWAPSGGTAATAAGLCAGTYTCTISSPVGCSLTKTFTITQPTPITATATTVQAICGNPNGSATVTPSGGSPSYTYSWAPSGGSSATATGLAAGSYTCTITDINGCIFTQSVFIINAGSPTATISASTNISCFGGNNGAATVTATGGTGPYTYAWTPSGGNTATASGLIAGSYTITVTDANGCSTTASIVLTQPPVLSASAVSTPVLCNAGNTGSTTVTALGGSPGYTYNWAPSGGTGANATGLIAATYTCTVTDTHGCTTTATATVTQPTALASTISTTPVLCNGGSTGTATVTPSGGTPAYSYAWAPSGGNAAAATGLAAGTYTCTITDANGCIITKTITVTQPTAISLVTSFVQSTCGNPNGSASVVASGGTAGYTYAWAPSGGNAASASGLIAGSYTVTVTDANLCTSTATVVVPNAGSPTATISASINISCFGGNNGSITVTGSGGTLPYTYSWNSAPVQTTASASALTAGSYTVTLTDANGCSTTASATITEPPALSISGTSTNVDCFSNATGTASVIVTGGSPNYSYAWTPFGGSASGASALTAGSYTCTVTDLNGCVITQSLTVTEPPVLTLASAGFNVSCFNTCDGQVVVIPTGGTPNYSFSWNTGCTSPSCNGICAGSYTVTVSDANGCVATSSTTVTQPTAISIVTSQVDAHCNQADGSAAAIASGGTGTLTYQWIGGPANANYNNITANTYSVIVTDANGCDDTTTATVNNLNGVTAALTSVTNLTCFNSNNGAIVTSTLGGISPYTYSWTAPALSTTGSASSLAAGSYTMTVTDSSGCTATLTATVTQPPLLTLTASANPAVVCSGATTQLSSTAGGGTLAYNYTWMPGPLPGNTQSIIPSATTTYTAYVVDANGCSDSTTVLVTVNPVPVAILAGDVLSGCAPLCVNFNDMSTIIAPGIINSWSWDFGDNSAISNSQNPSHCFANAGAYTVSLDIVTSSGCTASITMPAYVNVFANPVAAFGASPQPTTILNPTIAFTDSSSNAATWNWSFGDITNASSTLQNPSFTYADPTCYQVVLTVTSIDGCVDTTSKEICIAPDVTLFVPNAFTPNDDGKNDLFMPFGTGIDPDHFEMWIFDRWGNMIYYIDDINKGWDGKVQGATEIAQIDTYVWKIKATDVLGNKHNIEGKVSLIK